MGSESTNKLFPGRETFISYVLDALETKSGMSGMTVRYLQRSAMAGVIIALMYVANYGLSSALGAMEISGQSLATVGKIAGAIAFGFALVFIYFTRSELLTSNMMVVSVGLYYRTTTAGRAAKILGLCYVGNLLGSLLVAVLLAGSSVLDGAVMTAMEASVHHKIEYLHLGWAGWSDLLVRAILCNLLINLAMGVVYSGILSDSISKMVLVVDAIFIFVFLGFEHSVANTGLFLMVGLQQPIDWFGAIGNVVVALIGNFIGGGLLIGVYYAYLNDDAKRRPPDRA